jgi:hypothetical protein
MRGRACCQASTWVSAVGRGVHTYSNRHLGIRRSLPSSYARPTSSETELTLYVRSRVQRSEFVSARFRYNHAPPPTNTSQHTRKSRVGVLAGGGVLRWSIFFRLFQVPSPSVEIPPRSHGINHNEGQASYYPNSSTELTELEFGKVRVLSPES